MEGQSLLQCHYSSRSEAYHFLLDHPQKADCGKQVRNHHHIEDSVPTIRHNQPRYEGPHGCTYGPGTIYNGRHSRQGLGIARHTEMGPQFSRDGCGDEGVWSVDEQASQELEEHVQTEAPTSKDLIDEHHWDRRGEE